jgi:hypothetical protein
MIRSSDRWVPIPKKRKLLAAVVSVAPTAVAARELLSEEEEMAEEDCKEKRDAIVPRAGAGMVLRTVDEHKQFAMAAWAAGVLDEGDKTRAVGIALVKMQYGAELGMGPMSSIAGVNIIKGKPSIGAGIVAARIQAHPLFKFRQAELTDKRCRLVFFEREAESPAWEEVGDSVFTWEDARRAELLGRKGQMWEKYPRSMLFARALTDGARRFCPVVFSGSVYTPEELSDGAVLEADFEPVPEDDPPDDPPPPEPDNDPPLARNGGSDRSEGEPPPDADKPSALTIERLEALLAIAQKLPKTQNIQDGLSQSLADHANGSLGARAAGTIIGRAKKALASLGWEEPQEWIEARKERERAKRDAKREEAEAEKSGLWAKAAALRARLGDAGIACDKLDGIWQGDPDKRRRQTIVDAMAAGQAALDQAVAQNDPGEPPPQPLGEVLAELEQLAKDERADEGLRKAVAAYIEKDKAGGLTLEEATELRDQIRRFLASKEDDLLF